MHRGRGVHPFWAATTVCVAAALLICAWAVPSPAAVRRHTVETTLSTAISSPPTVGSRIAQLSNANNATRAIVTGPIPPVSFMGASGSFAQQIVGTPVPRPLPASVQSPCTGSERPDVASFDPLRELARERYGDRLRDWSSSTIAVVGFLLEPGSCRVVRDTIDWIPRESSYSGNSIADRLFHIANPTSFGLSRIIIDSFPEFMISYVMLPRPRASATESSAPSVCGIGVRSNETCSFDGAVVIRRVDSVRVLIAMVANGARGNAPQRQLFMFTSGQPLSPLLSRTIPEAHVEYDNGMVYVVSRSGSDPSMLFWVGKAGQPAPRRAAESFDQGLGLSMYSIEGFTADQIRRLEPVACADGERSATHIDAITGQPVASGSACYAVDGRVIRFPL